MTRKVGRPAYEPTPAERHKVAISAAGGMTHAQISSLLGISADTLEKYFAVELTRGAMEKRAEILAALFKAAKRGSASAARAFLVGPSGPPGKKEQASAAAAVAQSGTEWDDLLPQARAVQ